MNRLPVTGITLGAFIADTVIHYILGKTRAGEDLRVSLPPPGELVEFAVATGAFSLASGTSISALQGHAGGR